MTVFGMIMKVLPQFISFLNYIFTAEMRAQVCIGNG